MDARRLMLRAVEYWGDREAVLYRDVRLTYAQAWERGLRLANLLMEMGLQPGDRVAVLEDNSVEAIDFFIACTAANLVRVPLYARNSREAHAYMASNTGCRGMVVAERYAADVAGLDAELPELEHVLVRDHDYEELLAKAPNSDPAPSVSPDDLYIIRHTGGTTGKPKGLPFSHRQWLHAARDWFYAWPPIQLGDACLHVGPISHGSGYLFMPIWLSGGRNILVDKFDVDETLALMEAERVAYMFAVPTMLGQMARHESATSRDLSALKVINVAGAPVTEATLRKAREVFGDVLYQHYGQSEVLVATMIDTPEMFADIPGSAPLRSAGRALPFADVQIVDPETHEPLPVGSEGEVAFQTDGQVTEFWKDPETTARRLDDGWVLSGDIGRMDENGYVYVLDRVDDMIISGGFNIYPAELENVIASLPDVLEVAVFGVPHERWGETPAAVVVVTEGASLTEEQVVTACRDRLGSYKKPGTVGITTEPLPKSPVGKTLRRDLREPFWVGHDRRVGGT